MIASDYEKLRANISSSRANGGDYKVDLASYGGQGFCTCRDWECTRWPLIRDKEPPSGRTRCKHIKYLRNQLAEGYITLIHDQFKDRAYELLEFTVAEAGEIFRVNLLECDGKGNCQCSLFKEMGDCPHIADCRDDIATRGVRRFNILYPSNEQT